MQQRDADSICVAGSPSTCTPAAASPLLRNVVSAPAPTGAFPFLRRAQPSRNPVEVLPAQQYPRFSADLTLVVTAQGAGKVMLDVATAQRRALVPHQGVAVVLRSHGGDAGPGGASG